LGRTEDVRFAPGDRRLAVVGFAFSRILLLDVDLPSDATGTPIRVLGHIALTSRGIRRPHGIGFLDEQTLAVANREGAVTVFELPGVGELHGELRRSARRRIRGNLLRRPFTPGSIDLYEDAPGRQRLLVCNNYSHVITEYSLEPGRNFRVSYRGVLLKLGLNVPDGISISPDRRWIAVSNHGDGSVRLYENRTGLNRRSEPNAFLHGMGFPHGLRFTGDGKRLLVADAASPHLHIFERLSGRWDTDSRPTTSVRVMDQDVFERGRAIAPSAGPKGIDGGSRIVAMTSTEQVLQFFDLSSLQAASRN
jgi:hypothetical protein